MNQSGYNEPWSQANSTPVADGGSIHIGRGWQTLRNVIHDGRTRLREAIECLLALSSFPVVEGRPSVDKKPLSACWRAALTPVMGGRPNPNYTAKPTFKIDGARAETPGPYIYFTTHELQR